MGVYFAFIHLKIDGKTWIADSEAIMQINHIRLVGNTGSVVVEIYDDTAIEVETALLASSTREFEYWYGYDNGVESDHYTAIATKITPMFSGLGIMLTIEGTPISAYKSFKFTEGKSYSGTPSDIVRQVAADEGWKEGIIEPSIMMDATSESYEETTEFTVRRSAYEPAIPFITDNVTPYAYTDSGLGNFQLVLKETTEGTEVSYFPAGSKSGDSIFTYVIGAPTEDVISFEPQYGEIMSAILGSNGGASDSIDSITNEGVETNSSVVGNPLEVTDNVKGNLATSPIAQKSSTTPLQQEVSAANAIKEISAGSYMATLVLRGTPNIEVGRNITVNVYTRNGNKHFSSGEYMVQSAEDLIEGSFTTTLTLVRARQAAVTSASSPIKSDSVQITQGEQITGVPTPGEQITNNQFKVTAYCCCQKCCGKWSYEVTGKPNTTKSGTIPQQGRTIAVDPSVIPLGTQVMFNGHVYTAEDTGGAVKGNHIDLYFENHNDAVKWGVQYFNVYSAVQTVTPAPSVSQGSSQLPQPPLQSHAGQHSTGGYVDANGEEVPFYGSSVRRGNGRTYKAHGGVALTNGNVPSSVYYTASMKYLDIPYVWGGKNPSTGLDCSGFVYNVVKDLGYSGFPVGRARDQAGYGVDVPISGQGYGLDNARPGDLLFNGNPITHVMMYLGNGYMVHAPHTGSWVKVAKVYKRPSAIRRLFL